jgi:Ala-tRNA(Pro) deacylase
MADTVFDRLVRLLQEQDVVFEVSRHAPVFTSEEAARIRGVSLASGAKALICRVDERFMMFVMPADRKLDSRAVRQAEKVRKLRFASAEEVWELTGLKPGSIPPFGSLFGIPTLCDEALSLNERINFNAGDHSISVNMRYEDFHRVEEPRMGSYSQLG